MKVGPYELVGSLGRGATSEVFRGRGPDGADVAVKVFSHRSGSPEALDRFSREVRLQRALGAADGVVPIIDAGETALGAWLAMPLLGGGPLRERLRGVPWKVDDVVQLGQTLAAALGRAHALGIVHRDVKPENILYDDAGRPLLADLGLAKHFRADVAGASASLVLTRSGALVGTVGYMAPEQASDGRSAGPQADVFSLGAILYEALTGRYAFDGASPIEVLARLSHARVEPVRRARPEAPAWLAATIERALDPDPARRHTNGAELARALAEGPRAAPGRPITPLLAGVALLAVGASLAAIAYRAGQRAGEGGRPPADPSGAGVAAASSARERLRAARLLGEPAAADDVAAVRSLALAEAATGEAALLAAEAALGAGRPREAEEALSGARDDPRGRLLAAFAVLARDRAGAQASFEGLAAGGPLAAEAQLGAVRGALEQGDAARCAERLGRAARLVAAAGDDAGKGALQAALERGRAELRALEAGLAARAGEPGPGLSVANGEGIAAVSSAAARRRLARSIFQGSPPGAAAEPVLEALLRASPVALAVPEALDWLLARATRLATKDPLAAARSAEAVRLVDDTTALPPELGPALDTHTVGALVAGDEAQWLEGALAGLRLGRAGGLFPLGADAKRQGEIELQLERLLAARYDEWAARLFLARCLIRGAPPDHEQRLKRAEAELGKVLAAPLGTAARPIALETLGLVLAHQRRLPEAQAAFEGALAAWHPAPDELLLDLSYWSRESDPVPSLAWAERAVAARDARARGEAEPGRPRGLPLEPIDHARGWQAARVEARLVLVERALVVDRRARALEVARDCAGLESPGPLAARLIRAAVAAAAGKDTDARTEVEPLRASTGQDREELSWLAPWLVSYVKRTLRRRDLSRLLATDLGVE